jgi:hypothetical protein
MPKVLKSKQTITPTSLEGQEHLSKVVLESLKPSVEPPTLPRPPANFIDLMGWVNDSFCKYLKDTSDLNKFVHNRVIIDGQFMQFCGENSINVNCLYKDSVISWKTEHEFEKFFVQGVFLISTKEVEFLHAALFHKGNHNEDEISFFVIVSQRNYDEYVKLRNKFDDWVQKRDRDNLFIRVIDGEDIAYTKDCSWEELFLPTTIKSDIKSLVEGFLVSKDFYLENKIPWKRGILLFGKPGCHVRGTSVMMYDGECKNVEDIKVGEFLMGPDSKPREVLKLVRGNELCYEITPNKGESFIVNENHILHLCYSSNTQKNLPKYLNISVKEFLALSGTLRTRLKLRKKQFGISNTSKDILNVGIKSISPVGNHDYYGFIIDEDHLYLTGDRFIHHNCGKTLIIRTIISNYNFKPVTITAEANGDAIREAFSYAEQHSPALLFFEDLDSLLEKGVDISTFLNLMDGVSSKNGLLVIATANDIRKLKSSITDRPSRFDRKFQIPLPTREMAYIYLKRLFDTLVTPAKCKSLAEYAERHGFSYAYLKELYISSMYEALSNNRPVPTVKDIDNSLLSLLRDKNLLSSNRVVDTDKYFR